MPILLELSDQEADMLFNHLATTMVWAHANPILIKLSKQMEQKQEVVMKGNGADSSDAVVNAE